MRIILSVTLFIISTLIWGQTDYSKSWEDLFSYNDIKDFYNSDTHLVALSNNAIFIYDKNTHEYEKISSINGLVGETTSSFYYDIDMGAVVIGYENGIVEIINTDRTITLKPDIKNFGIIGSKRINHINAYGSNYFISTAFGIVLLDKDTKDFKDTLYIGDGSSEVIVNETTILNDFIYAVTNNGIFYADVNNPFLNDFNNWTQFDSRDFTNILAFNNELYVTFNETLYHYNGTDSLNNINMQPTAIRDITSVDGTFVLSINNIVKIYNDEIVLQQNINESSTSYTFDTRTAQVYENTLYIATKRHGILKSALSDTTDFQEIHPEGPVSNNPFSITAQDGDLWVVYGGYNESYVPISSYLGASHYNENGWVNIPYNTTTGIPTANLVHTTIDPRHDNRVYLSSYGSGLFLIENNEYVMHWDDTNSPLQEIHPIHSPIRVSGTTLDSEGNLWVTNVGPFSILKKYNTNTGNWTSYNPDSNQYGLNNIIIDKSDNKWIGTTGAVGEGIGCIVINKNASKDAVFNTNTGLPHDNVRAIAVDKNNRIWLGTRAGLVTFNSSDSFFDTSFTAKPIVLAYGDDDDYGEALLGVQTINTICVDGADNKWFGTLEGVLQTNSSGTQTLSTFNTTNSPLPSNNIIGIQFDEKTGVIYFATSKGIVAFDSKISPYGEHLESAYAYPNPARSYHEYVSIDGRNGSHLPNGTNVKILDMAGKLVYETNVKEGQENFGGKVVWDKTNLAGTKVASGVYIVLLTIKDASETAMTKIAIIN